MVPEDLASAQLHGRIQSSPRVLLTFLGLSILHGQKLPEIKFNQKLLSPPPPH